MTKVALEDVGVIGGYIIATFFKAIMIVASLHNKEVRAYVLLTSLVICGLATSLITATKIVHFGINFPFSNIVFSILTYPIVDCICELWGKAAARRAMWLGLASQILMAGIIQCSVLAPHPDFWRGQNEYETVLSTGIFVVLASCIAFASSQLLDIAVYQKLKEIFNGKKLWIRSNVATWLGQAIDSIVFVQIVFFDSDEKMNLVAGSIFVKIILSLLMTPVVYLIVLSVHNYLDSNSLAFKSAEDSKEENKAVNENSAV